MDYEDLITMLDAMESLDDRDAIRDGISEMGVASEGAQARIAELERSLAESQAKYTDTAARNWELMQAVTASGDVDEPEEVEEEKDNIDELFKDV